jgi:transposase
MAQHIDAARKEEVLVAIKNGMKVTEASEKYSVSTKAIYAWLKFQTDNTGTSSLELARLRRENQELKEIIGWFTLKEKRGEKNKRGA